MNNLSKVLNLISHVLHPNPMIDEIIIDGNHIVPGQQSLLQLSVAQLPSGTDIHLNVHVYRSRRKGPKVLVLGGLHGDEVNGVEIVRRSIVDELFENLQIGSVIAIPLLNIYGFINFSRDLPDGKDVNRSFPGSRNGSLASRVARTLTEHIFPYVDFGIDFHTGGSSRYNYPQIRFTEGDEQAEKLAKLFAAPYLIRNKAIDRSLRKEAQKRGIPMLVYEGGESLRLDTLSIEEGLAGLQRILHAKGMIADAPLPSHKSQLFTKSPIF